MAGSPSWRVASSSPFISRLPLDAGAEVVETRVEDGRARGWIARGDGAGWVDRSVRAEPVEGEDRLLPGRATGERQRRNEGLDPSF